MGVARFGRCRPRGGCGDDLLGLAVGPGRGDQGRDAGEDVHAFGGHFRFGSSQRGHDLLGKVVRVEQGRRVLQVLDHAQGLSK